MIGRIGFKRCAKLTGGAWYPEWQGRAMIGTDIINRRQTREVVTQFLAWKVGLRKDEPAPIVEAVLPALGRRRRGDCGGHDATLSTDFAH